ncbi:MAG: crossover junction endodeoxyribonuclease RuvC [Thermodesulfobacteriota bacterium]
MCIMGIDPGLITTGFGVIEINGGGGLHHCGSGVICPPSSAPFAQRLHHIYSGLVSQISLYKPDYMAVERPFFAKNVKSAMLLGEARGVAILAAAEAFIEVFELSPLEIKQAVVGYGRAGKEQVQKMVCGLLNISSALKADAADALAAALCLAHTLPYKNLLKSHRKK